MGITTNRLNDIVRGRRGITGDTALRLARATNTTPEFWLNLQSLYELETARDRLGERLDKEVTPIVVNPEDECTPGAATPDYRNDGGF